MAADLFSDILGEDDPLPMPAERIALCFFSSHRTAVAKREELSRAAFVKRLLQHEVGAREGSAFTPATFAGNRRRQANVEQVGIAVLDLDRDAPSPEGAAARLRSQGLAGLVLTTHSHRAATPRLRLILFPARPFRPDEYETREAAEQAFRSGLMTAADKLGLKPDPASTDTAHLFFMPRHDAGQPFAAIHIEGTAADVWPAPTAVSEAASTQLAVLDDEDGELGAFDDSWAALELASDIPAAIIRDAIRATPNDNRFDDRGGWFPYLAAIKNTLGEEAGRAVAEEWSRRWENGEHDPRHFDRTWRSIKPDRKGPKASVGTILMHAKQSGWADPRRPVSLLSSERQKADAMTIGGDAWAGAAHAARLRGSRLYVENDNQWLAWSGQRYAAQSGSETDADAKCTTAAMLATTAKAVADDPSPENRRMLGQIGKLHASLPAQRRMVESARSEPEMHVHSIASFDADPYALTCLNGILDLRTGRLRPAHPEDRVSKLAGAAFDPEAEAPKFRRFLEAIMPDPELRAFLQRVAGYVATGLVDEEVFFVCHGTGANGKSVLANVLAAALGEYAGTFGSALVTKNQHENEAERLKAALPGKRLALINETAAGDLWHSARIKELAGREKLQARQLYREPFDFMPTHKMMIRTNHLPGSLDAGDGFWRRCIPIAFATQIPEGERVPDLDRQIIGSELPGVLNWIAEGAQNWLRNGLRLPAAVRGEVEVYRSDTDLIGQWLAERTQPDASARETVKEAFQDYAAFCRDQGANAGTAMVFSRAMTTRGIKRDASHKAGRRFVGFRLRPAPSGGFDDDEEGLL